MRKVNCFGGSSPGSSPGLLGQDESREQTLKGREPKEEEGTGEVLCLATALVFKTCFLILTFPSSIPFLCIAL